MINKIKGQKIQKFSEGIFKPVSLFFHQKTIPKQLH